MPEMGTIPTSLVHLLFGFRGRIGRAAFWLGTIFNVVCPILAGLAAAPTFAAYFSVFRGSEPSVPIEVAAHLALKLIGALVYFLILLVCVWSILAVHVKRWHDRDKTWLWIFVGLVPLIGPLWVITDCGFMPGKPQALRFGPAPPPF